MSKLPKALIKQAVRVFLLLLASANLYAQQTLSVSLTGASEVPPTTTAAAGTGQITIDSDYTAKGSVKYSGMIATMAHIHEAATGKNGPPIIPLTPSGNDTFIVPPNAKLSSEQYKSYMAGNLYVNVHSATYPGGEIRGQLQHPEKAAAPMRPQY